MSKLIEYIARALLPHAAAQADQVAVVVERLVSYGVGHGLTEEAAREVVTTWSQQTPLSVVADEQVLHVPLMMRALGDPWEPDRYTGAGSLAHRLAPLVELLDRQRQ